MAEEKDTIIESLIRPSQRPVERKPSEAQERGIASYSSALQGKAVNGLMSASTSRNGIQIDAVAHTGRMDSNGVILIIDEEGLPDFGPQTLKTFIIFLRILTEQLPHKDQITAEAIQRARSVKLSLNDYMQICNLSDKKEARKQLNTAIRSLFYIGLEWDETTYEKPEGKTRKAKVTKHHRMRITDHTITEEEGNPIKNGAAEFRFSYDLSEYTAGTYLMPFPDALLTVNTHNNPYSLQFGWKLCALNNMNYGDPKRYGRTTVETLLKSAKGIPQYSAISKTGQIYDRIIKPFDRDLSALIRYGVMSFYRYYDEDGNEVKPEQLGSLTYTEFSALNIQYELKDYPDQTPRLEAAETKKKRIRATIRRNAKASKAKQTSEDGTQT